jgi:hypothetical protein
LHPLLVRIGLRPRRSALEVVPELTEFLRAAAGFGDLRGPLDGGFARREFQDTEAAIELLGLRVRLVRNGAVGGDHQRCDVLVDTTAEHIDPGSLRLAYDRVCRFADEEGRIITEAFGPYRSALLVNHGYTSACASIEESIYLAVSIEHAAEQSLLAMAAGTIQPVRADLTASAHDFLLQPSIVKATFAYWAEETAIPGS